MAPRDLAFSACGRKTEEWINHARNTGAAEAEAAAAQETEREAGATSCCAVMSCCSCSSPSVKAMITLAGPAGRKHGNTPACVSIYQPSNQATLKQTSSYQSSPVGSAHSP